MKQVLQEKLSVAQLRKIVSAEITHHTKQTDSSPRKKQVDQIILQVQEVSLLHVERTQLLQMQETLQKKLIEIESALKQENGI